MKTKLSKDLKKEIKLMYEDGYTQQQLSGEFGVSQSTINRILNEKPKFKPFNYDGFLGGQNIKIIETKPEFFGKSERELYAEQIAKENKLLGRMISLKKTEQVFKPFNYEWEKKAEKTVKEIEKKDPRKDKEEALKVAEKISELAKERDLYEEWYKNTQDKLEFVLDDRVEMEYELFKWKVRTHVFGLMWSIAVITMLLLILKRVV